MMTGAMQNIFEKFKAWVGKNDADAQDYFDHHEEWCRKFTRRAVPDWMTAPQSRLQDLIFNPNGYISSLGNALMQMHRPEAKVGYDQRWANEQGLREVCAALHAPGLRHYDEVRSIVPQQRKKFFGLVGYNAEVVFNRMLAALRIDLVVPVIDTGRALKLRQWLQQNGLQEKHGDAASMDWLEISYQIREALRQQVPDARSSERSVFAWYLAECLDGVDLPRHDVLRREMKLAGFSEMKVEAGVVVCNDEVVPDYWADKADKASVVRVEFGPNVRRIGTSAFSGCPNLETVVFAEGTEEVGMCAFAHCHKLAHVNLPASIRSIGGGAFVRCERLADVGIAPGGLARIALDRLLPFRGCAGRIQIEKQIAEENARRGRAVLGKLFDVLMADGHPYVAGYEEACKRFAKVEWTSASEADLAELIYSADNGVAHLGAYANCSLTESEWNAVDKVECRLLCGLLDCFRCDADFIAEQREEFNGLFGGNKKTRFNRMVAALLPEQVIQIPGEDALELLAGWLKRNGFLEPFPTSGDLWFATSAAIRRCMSAILPEKSVYECGVFCWFLAEALRGTNAAPERQERIRTVRAFLKSYGLDGK